MDAFKKEPEVDPLAIQTSDNTDLEEKKSISEEGNLLDLHVAAIKTECVDQDYDLTSEFKVEQISVGTNFIEAKCKAEEELCDLNTMKDELKLEENEILTNSCDGYDQDGTGGRSIGRPNEFQQGYRRQETFNRRRVFTGSPHA
ncbi:uncharacterized protein [Periplaneta americana]|uniref:uncharacterized protein isoform X2 n=1 Tax=Periplaneta americana TaxID=6978 RepID=UPI0037E9145F